MSDNPLRRPYPEDYYRQKNRDLNHELIRHSDDLPPVSNGRHQLRDDTIYEFVGFITSPYGLELGDNSPLIGRFGSSDGFICTGGGPAIYSRDNPFFMDRLYCHAPGGQLFDLVDTTGAEILVLDSAFSDAAGIANIADLGTIDGFRVPTFKSCNFEDFDQGLTLTGSSDKVFFSQCPFREVTASGAVILDFDSGFDADIVDIVDCYIKGIQADTEVVNVDATSIPDVIFQYRGVTHDATVNRDQILNGGITEDTVGIAVRDSYPLPNSKVVGDLSLDSTTTVTGSGSAPTQITGPTTLNNAIRTSSPSNGVVQYDARYETLDKVFATVSVTGINGQFAIWIAKNGSILPRTKNLGFASNSSSTFGAAVNGTIDLQKGDTVSLFVENTDGSADVDVVTANLNV